MLPKSRAPVVGEPQPKLIPLRQDALFITKSMRKAGRKESRKMENKIEFLLLSFLPAFLIFFRVYQ
jgi:hypothetical protein